MRVDEAVTLAYFRQYPAEAARRIEAMPPEASALVVADLPPSDTARLIEHCQPNLAAAVLQHLSPRAASAMLSHLPVSMAMSVLRQLPTERRGPLLDGMSPALAEALRRALSYPRGTAGAMSDPGVLTLSPDITVGEALAHVRGALDRRGPAVYLLEPGARFLGMIALPDLLSADARMRVGSIQALQVEPVRADAMVVELLELPSWRQSDALPVVDRDGVFLGALRYWTVRDVEDGESADMAPAALPHALLKLWELYALVGVRLMTDVATVMAREAGFGPEPRDVQDGEAT